MNSYLMKHHTRMEIVSRKPIGSVTIVGAVIAKYMNRLVFPEDFLTALRTIAMKEDEVYQVFSMLEELVGSEEDRQPSDTEVRTAIWEACGDSGALQLLVDLLQLKMMELEEGSGTEDNDTQLLENA